MTDEDPNESEMAALDNRLFVHDFDPASDYVLISPAWEVNEIIGKDWRYNEAFEQRQKEETMINTKVEVAAS